MRDWSGPPISRNGSLINEPTVKVFPREAFMMWCKAGLSFRGLLCGLALALCWPSATAHAKDLPYYESAKIEAVSILVATRMKATGENQTRWVTDWDMAGRI